MKSPLKLIDHFAFGSKTLFGHKPSFLFWNGGFYVSGIDYEPNDRSPSGKR